MRAIKIICSVRQHLNLCNKSIKLDLSNEFQQQAYAQGLELQDAPHGFKESRREQARLHEESSVKEKLLRDTQIRNIHLTFPVSLQ